ncbi:MAG: virulence factor SrfB [Rhodospirillaceae bacterium]
MQSDLAELFPLPPLVTIIPDTGIQFLDFGLTLVHPDGKRNDKVPASWGFFDPRPDRRRSAVELPTLLRRGDADVTSGRSDFRAGQEDYEITPRDLIESFGAGWLPLPLLREEPGYRHAQGPVNWARVHIAPLTASDADGHDHRLVIALDTALMERFADGGYLCPSTEDAVSGRLFSLPRKTDDYNFFLMEPWVRSWLDEVNRKRLQDQDRKSLGRREVVLSDEEIEGRKRGPNEPLSLYMALLDLLHELDFLPRFKLADTVTAPRQDYVDVDMVLDLGNSRTCGLLVEAEPGAAAPDIGKAFKLELRDLSRPEFVYREPFDSRFEFAMASFGYEHHSLRSGRADAFLWPTIVRVGPEAVRLAGARRGTEGRTGMSSPKRYLWDEDGAEQSWRFNGPSLDGVSEGYAAQGRFAQFVNDDGKALHLTADGEDDLPSFSARYARSHLVTFVLAEVLMQAMAMMNSPARRQKRLNADLPRRLRRLILTMPTALSLSERQILLERAQAARDLVYLSLNRASVGSDGILDWREGREPEIVLKWDEASATQVVYLYGQIARAFSGDARAFFRSIRGGAEDGVLRVATLDIGGGTSDLVITELSAKGQGANVTISPHQLFRESFSLAGDDLVRTLAREIVVESFRAEFTNRLGRSRSDTLIQHLFGGDRGDMTPEDQVRRQQFATQVAAPVVLAILAAYEGADLLRPPAVERRALAAFLPGAELSPAVVTWIERAFQQAGGGAEFQVGAVTIPVDGLQVDRLIRETMEGMLRALTEVAWRFNVDLMLLSGRPSRFAAIRDVILECGAIPAHRVIAMHEYRVGQWYPFRDSEARIADPKTTAAVGAMICLLAEGHLFNFNFRSDTLSASSVARFFGKIDDSGRILGQDVYYSNLDLEAPDYQLPASQSFEFRGPLLLGVRQFPQDWWPATLLYALDYLDEASRRSLQPKTPFVIRLKRGKPPRRPMVQRGAVPPPEVNDRLEIASAEGETSSATRGLRMRLQTLRNRNGYWLDTGILIDV